MLDIEADPANRTVTMRMQRRVDRTGLYEQADQGVPPRRTGRARRNLPEAAQGNALLKALLGVEDE